MAVNALIQAADDESSPATYDKIEDKISAYQKQFGSATVNGKTSGTAMLREEQVTLLKSSKDTTRYHTLITRLANDSDADVAAMAKKAQADEQMMEGLKLKPVDLAFTALDGSAVDLAKLRGKVVLIDFWATWCPPCRDEIPGIVAAYKKYHGKGFEVVGISLDQDKAALTKYVADNKMPWPQYFDGKGWDNAISSRFGIQSIPAMWLIGKDGKLATQNGRDNLGSHVAKLLGAK
jgi:thiol-disulfide isomerase/thioredoxin